jgi:hypothetical protein
MIIGVFVVPTRAEQSSISPNELMKMVAASDVI